MSYILHGSCFWVNLALINTQITWLFAVLESLNYFVFQPKTAEKYMYSSDCSKKHSHVQVIKVHWYTVIHFSLNWELWSCHSYSVNFCPCRADDYNLSFATWEKRGWCRLEHMSRELARDDGFIIKVETATHPSLVPWSRWGTDAQCLAAHTFFSRQRLHGLSTGVNLKLWLLLVQQATRISMGSITFGWVEMTSILLV